MKSVEVVRASQREQKKPVQVRYEKTRHDPRSTMRSLPVARTFLIMTEQSALTGPGFYSGGVVVSKARLVRDNGKRRCGSMRVEGGESMGRRRESMRRGEGMRRWKCMKDDGKERHTALAHS